MSYFADLTPFSCGGAVPDPTILNVGWLSCEHAFPVAAPGEAFVAALAKLTASPVNLCRGWHDCEFCAPPPVIIEPNGLRMHSHWAETMGNGEIWVEGQDGITYVAPVLVRHYVVEHRYAPPQAFVDAVIASA